MYKIVAPVVIPITKINKPSHFQKINPANKAIGEAKPAINIHKTVEHKKIKEDGAKLIETKATNKKSAITKLKTLGLSEDEISALIGE